jgi:dTDP-glucose pyrophosphorylase
MKKMITTPDVSVKDALKKLDISATKVLFIEDSEHRLIGALTDGDIRRFILNNGDLTDSIGNIYNKNPFYLTEDSYTDDDVAKAFQIRKIEVIPIVTNSMELRDVILWDQFIGKKYVAKQQAGSSLKDIPVVIMAGGKGTRLKPFTDVLPKPLVPIHEKPIMDWIITEFADYGAQQFYATLNYRGKMIEAYYGSIEKDYTIGFKWEDDFFGTAGSLALLKEEIDGTFIVSNCDIIVRANYDDVIQFHKESGAHMTVVSSIQHHQIPYGVLEFKNGGMVTGIQEKPEYSHAINTGVYILEPECLEFIPTNKFYHITHLMEKLIEKGLKVVTYPVNEKEYIDVGQWEEYITAVENFRF